jgi:hypothetical protein
VSSASPRDNAFRSTRVALAERLDAGASPVYPRHYIPTNLNPAQLSGATERRRSVRLRRCRESGRDEGERGVSRATPLSRSRGSRGVQEPSPGRPEEDGGHATPGRVQRVRNRGPWETPSATPPNVPQPPGAGHRNCACCRSGRIDRHATRTESGFKSGLAVCGGPTTSRAPIRGKSLGRFRMDATSVRHVVASGSCSERLNKRDVGDDSSRLSREQCQLGRT